MKLDPISLRLFIRVVETGTIAAAAEREHIAAAAVSKRLAELESQLDTPLLSRTNKGVAATAAGNELLLLARRVLHELDQIPVQIRDLSEGVRGLVRVWASMSAMAQFLPGDLQTFLGAHPGVRLRLEETLSSEVVRAVAENAADVGVLNSTPHAPDLEFLPYRRDRLVLCVPAAHRLADRESVAFEEIVDEDIVGMNAGSATGVLLGRAAASADKPLRMPIQAATFDSASKMIHHGFGVGLLPEAIATRNAATLAIAVIPLRDEWARRDFWITIRRGDSIPMAARLLSAHLSACRDVGAEVAEDVTAEAGANDARSA